MSKELSTSSIKKNNIASILKCVIKNQKMTRREIEEETQLSWSTVSTLTTELVSKDYLEEVQVKSNGKRGRKASQIQVNSSFFGVIGLDINALGLTCLAMNLSHQTIVEVTEPFYTGTREEVLNEIYHILEETIDAAKKKGYQMLGIGISMQGKVDVVNGKSLDFAGCYEKEKWDGIPLVSLVQERFHLLTTLDHDPNCFLYGESVHRDLKKNCILLRLDDGIGMAVRINGRLLRDGEDLEVGNWSMDSSLPYIHGGHGSLNYFASLVGLSYQADLSIEEFLKHAEEYPEIWKNTSRYLGQALYNLSQLFNPDEFVFAGVLLTKKNLFLEEAYHTLNRLYDHYLNKKFIFSICNEVSGAFGAASEVLDKVIYNLP